MAMEGNGKLSGDGQDGDDQSRRPQGSQSGDSLRPEEISQQHRRSLSGASREGHAPFMTTGIGGTPSAQHPERFFSPPRQPQKHLFSPSGPPQERFFSPSGQRQERVFSPGEFPRQSPISHEGAATAARPRQTPFLFQPTNSANVTGRPHPSQQEQPPVGAAGNLGGLESLMRLSRFMPTQAMIASRRMAQSLGSRTQGEAQNQQSMIIASLCGRDVVIEAMSVPTEGTNITTSSASGRAAESGFAVPGQPGSGGEASGGIDTAAATAATTTYSSPLHFWETPYQHGVTSVFTDAYRSSDQGFVPGSRSSETATAYNLIDRMDNVDTIQRYREIVRGQHMQQTARRDPRIKSSGGMAAFAQPRIIWVEGDFELRRESDPNADYSRKIFIGGLPLHVTPRELEAVFQPFGRTRCHKQADRGHAYVVFENGQRVAEFLARCRRYDEEDLYEWQAWGSNLQVIPWATGDNQYGEYAPDLGVGQLNFMVFVGALYGETTARQLALILESTCGPVQFVRIDTDRYQYPTGSARVQFGTQQSFLQALKIHYLEIRAHHYQRTIELNPFVEEGVPCARCLTNPSLVVCRALTCLKHYCNRCYLEHATPMTQEHVPVIRREQAS